jgi:hypothetical protein
VSHQGGHPRGWDCRTWAHRGLRWSKWLWCLPLQTAAASVASVGSAAAAAFSLALSPLSRGVHGECEVGRFLVATLAGHCVHSALVPGRSAPHNICANTMS